MRFENGKVVEYDAREGRETLQKLIEFDIEKIKKAGYSPVTAVLLTNSEDIDGYEVGVK